MLVQWRSGNNNGNTQSSRQPVGGGEGDMDGESRIKATTTVTKSSKIVAAICSTSSCVSTYSLSLNFRCRAARSYLVSALLSDGESGISWSPTLLHFPPPKTISLS